MAKKLIALTLVLVMALAMFAAPIAAGSSDGEFKGLTLKKFKHYAQAEVFDSKVSMRGFGASQDGKYYFGGYIGTNPGVVKFDSASGKPIAKLATGTDLPKGMATDDRGNLFIGLCNGQQKDKFGIITADMEAMKETARIEQTVGTGKVGINGLAVENVAGTYYLYIIVNYDFQRLYRFNANDPKNLKLDTSFGKDGYLDLETVSGVKGCEGEYLDVDELGDIYMSIFLNKGGDKADSIIKLSEDGEILAKVDCPEAYYVSIYGEYLATSTYAGADSAVYIFNTDDLKQVAKIEAESKEHSHFAGCMFYRDKIVVGEQNYNSMGGFWTVTGFELPEPVKEEAPKAGTTAPATADPATVVLFALVSLTGAGVVVSKKRK
nr:hypothetical protein [Clostridia bacterium]